jgi:hypothetical protein
MRIVLTSIAFCLAPVAALANADAILSAAAVACAEQDNGVFASEGAIRQIDLTGDGTPETLVDEGFFTCSTAASLYGGSAGSLVHVFVGESQSTWRVQGYETARWGDRLIVLLALHGTFCNATGADPCYEALTWGGERFLSVRPPAPVE